MLNYYNLFLLFYLLLSILSILLIKEFNLLLSRSKAKANRIDIKDN
jgi:hypothetical protein